MYARNNAATFAGPRFGRCDRRRFRPPCGAFADRGASGSLPCAHPAARVGFLQGTTERYRRLQRHPLHQQGRGTQ